MASIKTNVKKYVSNKSKTKSKDPTPTRTRNTPMQRRKTK